MSADLKRIRKMENYLNECTEATKELVSQLDRMNKVRKHMIALFDYYGSDEWFDDREAELPEGEWQVLMLNEKIDPEGAETLSGTVTVGGRTVLLVKAQ